jgi:hypothetical protein
MTLSKVRVRAAYLLIKRYSNAPGLVLDSMSLGGLVLLCASTGPIRLLSEIRIALRTRAASGASRPKSGHWQVGQEPMMRNKLLDADFQT